MNTIKLGSKGEDVKTLQLFLGMTASGVFDDETREAVVEYQKKNKLDADGIVGKKTWNVLMKGLPKKSVRKIEYIVVHCTATPEGQPRTLEQIRQEHVKVNGWSDIGYNVLVGLNGEIWNGRDVDKIPAHCEGYNKISIGVCYVGGVEYKKNTPYSKLKAKDTRTPQQKASLLKVLKDLRKLYPNAKIVGHRDLDKKGKACPCFDAAKEYKNI